MFFKIKNSEGKKFSNDSGDFNPIHLNDLTGYNSIYGEKICHGSLVFIKSIIKINKNKNLLRFKKKFSLSINFLSFFSYNKKITIKQNKNNNYLFQDNKKCADLIIKDRFSKINKNLQNYKLKYIFKINKKKKISNLNLIKVILFNISKYVGTINPGKNSILSNIEISFDKKKKYHNDLKIYSKKKDARLPIIENYLTCGNFYVQFNSLERPLIKNNLLTKNIKLIKIVRKIKNNVIIIGSSQGIGKDLMNILKENKKIVKICTYFRNKIISNSSKIKIVKIDLNKDLTKLNKLIHRFVPINIYYFASPKIFFHNNITKKNKSDFKKYYYDIPLKILKMNRHDRINFFYPSTNYIDINFNSHYSKVKFRAEKAIRKYCKKKSINFQILRLGAIKSRQTIGLNKLNLPDLGEYLIKNKRITKKFFLLS